MERLTALAPAAWTADVAVHADVAIHADVAMHAHPPVIVRHELPHQAPQVLQGQLQMVLAVQGHWWSSVSHHTVANSHPALNQFFRGLQVRPDRAAVQHYTLSITKSGGHSICG